MRTLRSLFVAGFTVGTIVTYYHGSHPSGSVVYYGFLTLMAVSALGMALVVGTIGSQTRSVTRSTVSHVSIPPHVLRDGGD